MKISSFKSIFFLVVYFCFNGLTESISAIENKNENLVKISTNPQEKSNGKDSDIRRCSNFVTPNSTEGVIESPGYSTNDPYKGGLTDCYYTVGINSNEKLVIEFDDSIIDPSDSLTIFDLALTGEISAGSQLALGYNSGQNITFSTDSNSPGNKGFRFRYRTYNESEFGDPTICGKSYYTAKDRLVYSPGRALSCDPFCVHYSPLFFNGFCEYHIRAQMKNSTLIISVVDFQLGSIGLSESDDYLQILDTNSSQNLAYWSRVEPQFKNLTTGSRNVELDLLTYHGAEFLSPPNYKGYILAINEIQNGSSQDVCQPSFYPFTEGFVYSPGYDINVNYNAVQDFKCMYYFVAIESTDSMPYTIQLTAVAFNTTKYLDWLIIYDGPDESTEPIAQWTGLMDNQTTSSTNNSLTARFSTASYRSDSPGFRLHYKHIKGSVAVCLTDSVFYASTPGNFLSPGFAEGLYGNNLHCFYYVTGNNDMKIGLQVSKFETQADVDIFVIHDGRNGNDTELATWSGSMSHDAIVFSTKSFVTGEFITDGSVGLSGFEIEYFQVPADATDLEIEEIRRVMKRDNIFPA